MTERPMIEALGNYPPHILSRLQFSLASSFRSIVEILAFYDRMDGFDEIDRLEFVRDWLIEALTQLYGQSRVEEWEDEARSSQYSPFT